MRYQTEIPPNTGFINVYLNEAFIAKQCGEYARKVSGEDECAL